MSPSDAGQAAQSRIQKTWADMISALEREMGQPALSEIMADIRRAGVQDSLPVLDDDDIHRFFSRLGWTSGDRQASGKRAEEIIREYVDVIGRNPAVVSIVFRLYAAGLYGVMPGGICGVQPRCPACALTKICSYYNAPPTQSSREKNLSPAERLKKGAEDTLNDEELLALVLGGGKLQQSHHDLAGELLNRYGALRKLSRASVSELESYASMGPTAALRLASAFALGRRTADETRRMGPQVRSGKDFYDLYAPRLRDLRQEVFIVVLLDQRNRVIRDEQVSQGSLTASLVHPREVFAPAIRESAAAVAFIHNHPSGDPMPSPEDKALTKRLMESAAIIGIRVLDHVIVGDTKYTSFVDENLLRT